MTLGSFTSGIELGRDNTGHVVLMASGQTDDGRECRTVVVVFSEDDAMKLAEAVKRCVYSEDVQFVWHSEVS